MPVNEKQPDVKPVVNDAGIMTQLSLWNRQQIEHKLSDPKNVMLLFDRALSSRKLAKEWSEQKSDVRCIVLYYPSTYALLRQIDGKVEWPQEFISKLSLKNADYTTQSHPEDFPVLSFFTLEECKTLEEAYPATIKLCRKEPNVVAICVMNHLPATKVGESNDLTETWTGTAVHRRKLYCNQCQKPLRVRKQCTHCRGAYYCSVDCQITAWPVHKPNCK